MTWKDNSFGIVIDSSMKVDFASLKSQGVKFIVVEVGKGDIFSPVFKDQLNQAKAADIPALVQYIPYPAIIDYTFDGVPQAELSWLLAQISGKTHYGIVLSIEEKNASDDKTYAGSAAISNTSKVMAETLASQHQKVFIRSSTNFINAYAPGIQSSCWTDKFGFFLADWRYRTRNTTNGEYSIYNNFPSEITHTVQDIIAKFPSVDLANPIVPGNAVQLKFWEYTNKYSLDAVTSWSGGAKIVKTVLFNGNDTTLYSLLGFTPTTSGGGTPPVDPIPSSVEERLTALENKFKKLLAALQ